MAEAALADDGRARSRPAGERHQVVVHVDAAALAGDANKGGCELEHGPSIPVEAARRLACDGSLVGVGENANGQTLSVGRKQRAVPPAMRRALKARDRGCRFPGCTNHRFVDAHHIHHWAKGGETKLGNLVQLCKRHHRLVHEGGFTLSRLPGDRLLFRRPDGRPLPAVPSLNATANRRAARSHRTRSTTPKAFPLAEGRPMNLGPAVDALLRAAPP